MSRKNIKKQDFRVNVVFSIIAFTWLINTALFSYLPLHSREVPRLLNLVMPFSFLYWAVSGFPYIFMSLVFGRSGPLMIVPLLATAVYWWMMSVWIVGTQDKRRNRDTHTAKKASAIARGMAPTPLTKLIGVLLSALLLLILILRIFVPF